MANAKVKTEKTKYADMIFPDEKSVKNDEKIEAIEQAILDVTVSIAAANSEVRRCTKALNLACRTVPFNAIRKIECEYDLEEALDKLSRLENTKEDLF